LICQVGNLMKNDSVRSDFNEEMTRFLPKRIKEATVDNEQYWAYVQLEVKALTDMVLNSSKSYKKFDMG